MIHFCSHGLNYEWIFELVRIAVMWCLEALPRLEAALRQNFHCLSLGLGLD